MAELFIMITNESAFSKENRKVFEDIINIKHKIANAFANKRK